MTYSPIRYLPHSRERWARDADVVVVGSGAAGMSAALEASASGRSVILICKHRLESGSTAWAQGGLAAAMSATDSIESHVGDTLIAGAGLSDEAVVRAMVAAAPSAVKELVNLGARVDQDHLGLEGGHSHHRIVHAGGDATGAEIHRVLRRSVRAANIEVLEHTVAIDALLSDAGVVVGLLVGKVSASANSPLDVGAIRSRAVVIATGGLGQAFASTTNPAESTGDGVALAARAGAEIADIEFVQFHPTVLHSAGQRGQAPLITEALRGAGATIVDDRGVAVMAGVHERGDLAPRDVVAFTMHQRMMLTASRLDHLWLDARALGSRRLELEFPTVTAACRARGIDPATACIPVRPGAHYSCGGVLADVTGRTSLPGLFAVGEVASTGFHGANRLASNSLTEALTVGRRVGELLRFDDPEDVNSRTFAGSTSVPHGAGVSSEARDEMADAMANFAGVVRTEAGLGELLERLSDVAVAPTTALSLATLEATNLHAVSTLVATAAAAREESRGCHRRADFPSAVLELEHRTALRVIDGYPALRSDAQL